MELKELNEKQRADHANSQMKLIKTQSEQLESRNEELETKFADVSRANMDLQKTERELRDQLVKSIPEELATKLNQRIEV